MREKTIIGTAHSTQSTSDKWRIITLVIGDMLLFLIFAAIGRRSHSEGAGPGALLQIAQTAAPFAAAWFIVSPFVGAFRRGLERQPSTMALRTSLSWLAAWPVSMALRGIFVDHAIPPWTFALITLVANMILLLLWRVPFAAFNKFRKG